MLNDRVVCSIGTTDPWNAAGLGLDVLALHELGARPVTVVESVSAQDRHGVRATAAVDTAVVLAQLATLRDAGIAAFQIGALTSAANVAAIARAVAQTGKPVVYDPVLGASAGGHFADDATIAAIVEHLVPVATVVTPNVDEIGRLAEVPRPGDVATMTLAGRALVARGARAVVVTGGDLDTDPVDVLVEAGGARTYAATRVPGTVRGTGCLFACALASGLALGRDLGSAVERAGAYVRLKIGDARSVGPMRTAF